MFRDLGVERDEHMLPKARITRGLQQARDTRCGIGGLSEKLIQRVTDDFKRLFAANQSCNQSLQLSHGAYTIIL